MEAKKVRARKKAIHIQPLHTLTILAQLVQWPNSNWFDNGTVMQIRLQLNLC